MPRTQIVAYELLEPPAAPACAPDDLLADYSFVAGCLNFCSQACNISIDYLGC
jgi:hypothetical protein